jgi:hypothetical protein
LVVFFLPVRAREVFFALLRDDFRDGTFAPFSLASLRPIAIACLRLVTFLPDPLLSVPFFLRLMVDLTRLDAAFPYFAIKTPPTLLLAKHVLKRVTAAHTPSVQGRIETRGGQWNATIE